MKFNQNFMFLFLILAIFYCHLSLAVKEKEIIQITLGMPPPGAYAVVSVGNPPSEQRLLIDTGSDLTWVVYDPDLGYDPSKSSSFRYKSCDDGFPETNSFIPIGGQCRFFVRLADNSTYIGTYGTETFAYGNKRLGILRDVLFGFGKTIGGLQAGNGSLGLKLADYSTVNLFGRKFSICIESFNNISGEKNFLAFGNDAVFTGLQVSLYTEQHKYNVIMTSIVMDGESLGIESVLSKYETILDTGTAAISLVPEVYIVVVRKIWDKMFDAGYTLHADGGLFCYNGTIPPLDIGVDFIFGIIPWKMNTMKLFIQVKFDRFCLFMDESPINSNLIGITMFQGHNIGFDVPNNKVYIKPMENSPCYTLYDDDDGNDELEIPNP